MSWCKLPHSGMMGVAVTRRWPTCIDPINHSFLGEKWTSIYIDIERCVHVCVCARVCVCVNFANERVLDRSFPSLCLSSSSLFPEFAVSLLCFSSNLKQIFAQAAILFFFCSISWTQNYFFPTVYHVTSHKIFGELFLLSDSNIFWHILGESRSSLTARKVKWKGEGGRAMCLRVKWWAKMKFSLVNVLPRIFASYRIFTEN